MLLLSAGIERAKTSAENVDGETAESCRLRGRWRENKFRERQMEMEINSEFRLNQTALSQLTVNAVSQSACS